MRMGIVGATQRGRPLPQTQTPKMKCAPIVKYS